MVVVGGKLRKPRLRGFWNTGCNDTKLQHRLVPPIPPLLVKYDWYITISIVYFPPINFSTIILDLGPKRINWTNLIVQSFVIYFNLYVLISSGRRYVKIYCSVYPKIIQIRYVPRNVYLVVFFFASYIHF